MQRDHLRALTAIVDEGTFEAAADRLGVTPSAVSQRVKALEAALGHVVLRRTVPCTPTDAGAVLVRMARQMQLLEAEALAELGGDSDPSRPTSTPVAVNADSLATWLVPVLHEAATWADSTLDLRVEDESHSSALLRRGDVLAAVTSDPAPVNGCRIELLGRMRYLPVATPELLARHRHHRRPGWDTLPVVDFNAKDDLQQAVLRSRRVGQSPPRHTVPSSEGFLAAVRAGLGWGMLPEGQLGTALEDGELVLLAPGAHTDVALYWQAWKLDSPRLGRLGRAVRSAGTAALRTG